MVFNSYTLFPTQTWSLQLAFPKRVTFPTRGILKMVNLKVYGPPTSQMENQGGKDERRMETVMVLLLSGMKTEERSFKGPITTE